MFDDPKALTGANWNDIHFFLQWFWIYFPLVVTVALTVLTAHAIIPSLIITGHLPAKANAVRLPLSLFALVVFAAAVVMLVLGINSTLDVANFWDRYLISAGPWKYPKGGYWADRALPGTHWAPRIQLVERLRYRCDRVPNY